MIHLGDITKIDGRMNTNDKADSFFVYKYVSKDDRIVYIGKSQSLFQRIKQHSSFNGIDEKFSKYKDADIYVHKCSSRHEMDALETLLIETYKPELNVSCKTDSPLSFSFCPEIEWVNFRKIEKETKQENAKKERCERNRCSIKKKSCEYSICSVNGQEKFKEAVADWHNLFYFISWISEQDDTDTRATIEFGIGDRDVDEWIWSFPTKEATLQESGTVQLSSLYFKNGSMSLVSGCSREHGRIWIDLFDQVCKLKQIIPSMKNDLNNRKKKIQAYYIDGKYIEQCKTDGFYDFYAMVNHAEAFPEYLISEYELSESEKLIKDHVLGNEVKHTSPDINWSNFSNEELLDIFFSIGMGRRKYFRVGGKYWNAYGADKLSSYFAREIKS